MKLTIVFVFCVTYYQVFSQDLPININTKKIEYEKIFEFSNKNKVQLCSEIKIWLNSNSLPILLEDTTQNIKIISEKIFKTKWSDKSLLSTIGSKELGIQYKIIFDIKEQKIRCRVAEIYFLEYKNPTATGIYWGYGITTSKIKEGEIISTNAENYYPADINKGKYKEMYAYFFNTINEDVLETIKSINTYITTENNNW